MRPRHESFFMDVPRAEQTRNSKKELATRGPINLRVTRGMDQPGQPHLPGNRARRGQPGVHIDHDRLPEDKQHIGRKLGLAGALVMRILFLCFASFLVHMTAPLFTIDLGPYAHGFSVRDLVLLVGGGYLIYKGIAELRDTLKLTELKAEHCEEHKALHRIALPQAVGTIMVMDLVFSIDSVITAVGMADHLIIMIIAVMLAVFLMMIFIDPISNFINGHPEMKMLALTFIVAIGGLLVIDSAGFHTGIELLHMPLEKLIVYFAMVFCIVLELIQMRYNANFLAWRKDRWKNEAAAQIDSVRAEMMEQMKREDARPQDADASGVSDARPERITPVIIGNNVYVMMPMAGEDAASFKELMATSDTANAAFGQPLEIGAQVEDVPASEDPSYEVPEGK